MQVARVDVWYGMRSRLHSPLPDAGSVLKVVVLQKQSSAVTEEVVLEELQVFKVGDAHRNGELGWRDGTTLLSTRRWRPRAAHGEARQSFASAVPPAGAGAHHSDGDLCQARESRVGVRVGDQEGLHEVGSSITTGR